MEYEWERDGDGAIAERLEVIATNLYYQNKILGSMNEMLEDIASNLLDISVDTDKITRKENNNE